MLLEVLSRLKAPKYLTIVLLQNRLLLLPHLDMLAVVVIVVEGVVEAVEEIQEDGMVSVPDNVLIVASMGIQLIIAGTYMVNLLPIKCHLLINQTNKPHQFLVDMILLS